MTGTAKIKGKMRVLMYKIFCKLRDNARFKKHGKLLLIMQEKKWKDNVKFEVFKEWERWWRKWKVKKNKDDFEASLKREMQVITGQY